MRVQQRGWVGTVVLPVVVAVIAALVAVLVPGLVTPASAATTVPTYGTTQTTVTGLVEANRFETDAAGNTYILQGFPNTATTGTVVKVAAGSSTPVALPALPAGFTDNQALAVSPGGDVAVSGTPDNGVTYQVLILPAGGSTWTLSPYTKQGTNGPVVLALAYESPTSLVLVEGLTLVRVNLTTNTSNVLSTKFSLVTSLVSFTNGDIWGLVGTGSNNGTVVKLPAGTSTPTLITGHKRNFGMTPDSRSPGLTVDTTGSAYLLASGVNSATGTGVRRFNPASDGTAAVGTTIAVPVDPLATDMIVAPNGDLIVLTVTSITRYPDTSTPNAPALAGTTVGDGSATVGVTAPATSPTLGGMPASYTVTASPGGAFCTIPLTANPLACTVTGLTNGTTYTFTATTTSKNGNTSESSAASASVTPVAVVKTPVTITADSLSKTYGDADPTFTYKVTGLDAGDSLTKAPTCTRPAGEFQYPYTITCAGAEAADKYEISYATGQLTFTKRAITVTPTGQSITYGDALPTSYPYTITTGSLANGDELWLSCGVSGTPVNAGQYPITCSGPDMESIYYDITLADANLTIAKKDGVVTPDPKQTFYGGPDPLFTYSISGVPTGYTLDTAPTCGVAGAHTNAGEYTITCAGGVDKNYNLTQTATATFTVNQATVLVSATNKSKVYGAADPTFDWTVTGLLGTDTLITDPTCGVPATHINAGSYQIICTGADAGPNYTVTYRSRQLTVRPASLTVTVDDTSRTTTEADPTFTATGTGLVNGDTLATALAATPVFATTATATSGAGQYPITITNRSDIVNRTSNYGVTFVAGTLTVTKTPVTVTPTGQSITYGDALPDTYPYEVTTGALASGDTLTGSCGVTGAPKAVGSYPITCDLSGGDKYDVTVADANLVIAKKDGIVTPDPQTITYGQADPEFTYTVSGVNDPDTLDVAPTCGVSGAHAGAGEYTITCSGGADSDYEVVQTATATLTVGKAPVLVTANNAEKVYGAADPAFAGTPSGLLNGDTLTTAPTCGVAGAHASVGTYDIACSGASAGGNYAVTYEVGTLTVTKANLTLTADDKSRTTAQANPTFTATPTGLVNGDTAGSAYTGTPEFSTTANSTSPVGTYPITITAGTVTSANYEITYAPGTLTVTTAGKPTPSLSPGALVITTSNRGKTIKSITVSAKMTNNGAAVAGKAVTFTVPGFVLCAAKTNASGVATCSIGVIRASAILFHGGYTATFAGDATYGKVSVFSRDVRVIKT